MLRSARVLTVLSSRVGQLLFATLIGATFAVFPATSAAAEPVLPEPAPVTTDAVPSLSGVIPSVIPTVEDGMLMEKGAVDSGAPSLAAEPAGLPGELVLPPVIVDPDATDPVIPDPSAIPPTPVDPLAPIDPADPAVPGIATEPALPVGGIGGADPGAEIVIPAPVPVAEPAIVTEPVAPAAPVETAEPIATFVSPLDVVSEITALPEEGTVLGISKVASHVTTGPASLNILRKISPVQYTSSALSSAATRRGYLAATTAIIIGALLLTAAEWRKHLLATSKLTSESPLYRLRRRT